MTTSSNTRTERQLVDSIRKAKGGTDQPAESAAAKPPAPKAEPAPAPTKSAASPSTPARRRTPAKPATGSAPRARPRPAPKESDPKDAGGSESDNTHTSGRRVWPD
jgi:hypothetical protein